ncbi:putative oxidoreductase [Candidatus Vecturithrix granuli]|uniref:Putative oxidoreductase n=1 Tax=Vecturithrix granuli TaxID=1499967 RepID=A0A081C626_VECG1|nr:putative oxidoreductase [Candidatus Vecturithrix granuli]
MEVVGEVKKTYRITEHPILTPETRKDLTFFWKGEELSGKEGESIATALFANGIRTFGYHSKDGAPLGIFCANGQCSQCTVLANGLPVKACMELIQPGMQIEPVDGNPPLPDQVGPIKKFKLMTEIEVECLIIGGGPAGLSAAIELGRVGAEVLIVDDKHLLGGKLVLQTHRFFGSINACYAGTRGIDIASRLEKDVRKYNNVNIWTNTIAIATFSDGKVGVLRDGRDYFFIRPKTLLVAAGAREKSLVFKGNTLPGVYGAGAFQTLVNRDLIRPAERLFIVGGGNVGLIAGYHALQAGIDVVGLIEALPECGGYKVHKDKLARFGVPIYTSHTILSANGEQEVESVTIAQIDDKWKAIPGTEKTFACDTILIAVGLNPVNEFYQKAKDFGMPVFAAGDAEEIAEASAAMFSGKIKGLEIARLLGYAVGEIPQDWIHTGEILKSRPGKAYGEVIPEDEQGIVPVFHCDQEIPCNPCTSVCPLGNIYIDPDDIRKVPEYIAEKTGKACIGCEKCVTICPGLAITLVDYRKEGDPIVTIAYEFGKGPAVHKEGDIVTVLDIEGHVLGNVEVVSTRITKATDRTVILKVRAPREYAKKIAGVLVQNQEVSGSLDQYVERLTDDMIVCRCERVTMKEIKDVIQSGCRDVNEIKARTRAGMGACGGKTCESIILRAFQELGIPQEDVTTPTHRPLFVEIPFGVLAGVENGGKP